MSQHISDREKIMQIRFENALWKLGKHLNFAQNINNFESGGIVFEGSERRAMVNNGESIINHKHLFHVVDNLEVKKPFKPFLNLGFYPVDVACEVNPSQPFSFGVPRIIKP